MFKACRKIYGDKYRCKGLIFKDLYAKAYLQEYNQKPENNMNILKNIAKDYGKKY